MVVLCLGACMVDAGNPARPDAGRAARSDAGLVAVLLCLSVIPLSDVPKWCADVKAHSVRKHGSTQQ